LAEYLLGCLFLWKMRVSLAYDNTIVWQQSTVQCVVLLCP